MSRVKCCVHWLFSTFCIFPPTQPPRRQLTAACSTNVLVGNATASKLRLPGLHTMKLFVMRGIAPALAVRLLSLHRSCVTSI